MANETFTANQTTNLLIDNDGDGLIDPGALGVGDTVVTTVTITNNSTTPTPVDATGVSFTETLAGMTIVNQMGADVNVSPLAFNDAYNVVGNTTFTVSAADGVLNGPTALHFTSSADAEFFGATIGASTTTQTHIQTTGVIDTAGGSVTLNADGSFTYTPDAGFTGADSFTYTLIDLGLDGAVGGGDDLTGTGTVSFNVEDLVWFIDNTGGGSGGSGTQSDPFKSIASFNAVNDGAIQSHPADGDTIYLREGTGTYSEADGINLLNNQILIGQGENLVINHSVQGNITVETGSVGDTPTIVVTGAGNQAIQLAQNNNIHGLNVGMNNATAVGIADGGGTVGNLTISNVGVGVGSSLGQAIDIDQGGGSISVALNSVTSSGGVNGIELAGAMTGSFAASNSGTLSGHSGAEISLNGGSANFSYGGTIGDGTGDSAQINNRTGGTVTLSGNINDGADAGGGIGVSGNANTTINFTGGTKTLNTGIGDGVSMTNNTGTSNVNFTGGGLDIDTTNGTGFQASVAGTYSVTGTGNSITTNGNGEALNLNGVVVGAGGVTFDSITATNGTGDGIHLQSVTGGGVTVGTVNLNGMAGDGIEITTSSANVSINGGTIGNTNDPGGIGVDINGGTGNVTISATVNKTTAGDVVEVTGRSTGTVDFNGGITSTSGGGIDINTNTGGTVRFDGGMNLSTGAVTAFNATGNTGMTLVVTDTVSTANILTTTTGTALNVANTTIGAEDLTFQSISSNGGSTGIILNTTGTAGGLHVTGTGAANSGGIIQATSGNNDGISLINTSEVSFNNIRVANTGGDGISGNTVHGFSLTNSTIFGAGDGDEENGIVFGNDNVGVGTVTALGVDGTVLIQDVTIDGNNDGTQWGVRVYNNQDGATLNMNIQRLTVQNNNFTNGEQGVSLLIHDGTANVLIDDSDFLNTDGSGVSGQVGSTGSTTSALLNLTIQNTNFDNNEALPSGVNFTTTGNATGRLEVPGGSITNGASSGIDIDASENSRLDANIHNVTITNPGIGQGIEFIVNENAVGRAEVRDNNVTITATDTPGMTFQVRNVPANSGQTGTLDLTLEGNTVSGITSTGAVVAGFRLLAGASGTAGQTHPNTMTVESLDRGGCGQQRRQRHRQCARVRLRGPAATRRDIRVSKLCRRRRRRQRGRGVHPGQQSRRHARKRDERRHPDRQCYGQRNHQLHRRRCGPAGRPDAAACAIARGERWRRGRTCCQFCATRRHRAACGHSARDTTPPQETAGNTGSTGETPPAAPAAHPVIVNDGVLSQAELDYFVDAAIARWADAGLTAEQVAALRRR